MDKKNKKENLEQTAERLFAEAVASIEKVATSFMENALKFVTDVFHIKTMCAMSKANKLLMFVIAGYIFLYAPFAAKIMLTIVPVLWLLDYFNVNLNFGSDKKDEKEEVKVNENTVTDLDKEKETKPQNISEISDGFIVGAEKMFSTFLKRSEEFFKGSFDDEKTCEMSFSNKLLRVAIFGVIIVEIPLLLQAMLVVIVGLWIADYFEFEFNFIKKNEKSQIDSLNKENEDLKQKLSGSEYAHQILIDEVVGIAGKTKLKTEIKPALEELKKFYKIKQKQN